MRPLRYLFDKLKPSRVCKRTGTCAHEIEQVPIICRRHVLTDPSECIARHVAVQAIGHRSKCPRCGKRSEWTRVDYVDSIQRLTLPAHLDYLLNTQGWILA